MTRETEPPPVASEETAKRRVRRDSEGLSASRKQLYAGAAALLLALATAIPALVNSCQAQSAASAGVERADQADNNAVATYDVAKGRLAVQADVVARHAEKIAELQSLVNMLVKRCLSPAERRAIEVLSPPEPELPPELTEPLPATPEQAAAEAAAQKKE
jgi:hypothetical protein